MATHRPLVVVAGTVQQLPTGDSVLGAGAAGASYTRTIYTATAGQTVFAAVYSIGYADVYLNGVKLILGTDFTATNGTSITLAAAAALDDTLEVVAYAVSSIIAGATGTATLDFGTGNDTASVVVTGQTALDNSRRIEAWLTSGPTADNDGDAHRIAASLITLTTGDLIEGTGFTITAIDPDSSCTGLFQCAWLWA